MNVVLLFVSQILSRRWRNLQNESIAR